MSLIVRAALALALSSLVSATALATELRGKIASIDAPNLLIVLDDGSELSVPQEFYIDDLEAGMQVIVEYEIVGGAKVISDLEIDDEG